MTADPEGTFDIYTMKLSAGDPELRLIVTDGVLPFWSPDGRHLIDPGQLRPAAGRVPGRRQPLFHLPDDRRFPMPPVSDPAA